MTTTTTTNRTDTNTNTMNNEIEPAIERSVSSASTVTVTVPDLAAQAAAVEDVFCVEDFENCDYGKQDDGAYEVWGTTDAGGQFRLRIVIG